MAISHLNLKNDRTFKSASGVVPHILCRASGDGSVTVLSEAYVLKVPLMAVVNEETAHLVELPEGALFYSASGKPDSHGMIKGMCKGHMVTIFACDLAERAEPLARSN